MEYCYLLMSRDKSKAGTAHPISAFLGEEEAKEALVSLKKTLPMLTHWIEKVTLFE